MMNNNLNSLVYPKLVTLTVTQLDSFLDQFICKALTLNQKDITADDLSEFIRLCASHALHRDSLITCIKFLREKTSSDKIVLPVEAHWKLSPTVAKAMQETVFTNNLGLKEAKDICDVVVYTIAQWDQGPDNGMEDLIEMQR